MIYPVYVWRGGENTAHGAQVHDFPGCFTAADQWEELPVRVQEAVELWCQGENAEVPKPTPLDGLIDHPDYQGGFWMLIDIDIARLDTRPLRLNISLPSGLVREIDSFAAQRHLSRSGFLAMAAREAIRHQEATD